MADSAPADPMKVIQSRGYLQLLAISALLGIPISALAYFFLKATNVLQEWAYVKAPDALGYSSMPDWWPIIPLTMAGLAVGLVVTRLPGQGGEVPILGFSSGGETKSASIPGIALAALASIGLGAVIGPEGPLIALGGGVALWMARTAKHDLSGRSGKMISASGSFAAISTLLGSPLSGAFLMMEAAGLGGSAMQLVLIPGLLASGVGYLVFLGLDNITGFGTFSLAVPSMPAFSGITAANLVLAAVMGIVAPFVAFAIQKLGWSILPLVERRVLLATTFAGLIVGLLAASYAVVTGESASFVLFSGQNQMGSLISNEASLTTGALLLMVLAKSVAYGVSLASFRGGMTFPALFIGTAIGVQIAHWTGTPFVATVAIGMAAMTVAMLKMPFTSVLIATLLMGADGVAVMPLVIIAVVLSFVVSARLPALAPSLRSAT